MRVDDVEAVQRVEVDAGTRFRSFPDPRVAACADHAPYPGPELEVMVAAGRGWVAIVEGVVVGFVVVEHVDGCGHVEELAVAGDHGGRGIGTALLEAAVAWAANSQFPAVTLTTFREVPWNRPFYERRGFRVLADAEITTGLRAKVVEEQTYGLPAEIRVVMRRDVPTPSSPSAPRRENERAVEM